MQIFSAIPHVGAHRFLYKNMKFNFYFCKSEGLNGEDNNFRPHNRSHIFDFYKIKKRYDQEATRYTEGDIGVCGIAVWVNFSCGISVILILNCVIAVFSESAG